ncbi:MAG: ankyrin repeat domain-containing protein [Verrucomicrobiota bacterium]
MKPDPEFDRQNRMLTMVMAHELDEVKTLVAEGADVNFQYDGDVAFARRLSENVRALFSNRRSSHPLWSKERAEVVMRPLHFALTMNQPEMVDVLIQLGADPNLPTDGRLKSFPIHMVVAPESERCLEILLEAGADVNQPAEMRDTPLRMALHDVMKNTNAVDIVELLLEHGADATGIDGRDMRLLPGGQVDLIALLLKHGADPGKYHIQNSRKSPTEEAKIRQLLFLYGVTDDVPESRQLGPLCSAIHRREDQAKIRRLLEVGVDPNEECLPCIRPLHLAAGRGDKGLAELLLNAGAHVDGGISSPDETTCVAHETPASIARSRGHADLVRLMARKRPVD